MNCQGKKYSREPKSTSIEMYEPPHLKVQVVTRQKKCFKLLDREHHSSS